MLQIQMRGLAVAIGTLAVICAVWCAEEKKAAEAEERPKIFTRLIPADVLRDFPGLCFASTRCATIEPGHTWPLTPYCGRSTCIKSKEDESLLELVEDCGPLPKPNPKCKLDEEKTNKTAEFPNCCPVFTCEDGAKLEFPEIATLPPPPAETTTKA